VKIHEHLMELNKEHSCMNENYELLNYEIYYPGTFNLKLFNKVCYFVCIVLILYIDKVSTCHALLVYVDISVPACMHTKNTFPCPCYTRCGNKETGLLLLLISGHVDDE